MEEEKKEEEKEEREKKEKKEGKKKEKEKEKKKVHRTGDSDGDLGACMSTRTGTGVPRFARGLGFSYEESRSVLGDSKRVRSALPPSSSTVSDSSSSSSTTVLGHAVCSFYLCLFLISDLLEARQLSGGREVAEKEMMSVKLFSALFGEEGLRLSASNASPIGSLELHFCISPSLHVSLSPYPAPSIYINSAPHSRCY